MIFGILIGICATLFIEFILYMVYNKGKKSSQIPQMEVKDIDNREKMINQGFHNVLYDYDIDVAMGRRTQC